MAGKRMKRTQILFPDEQYERLREEAKERGCSVGELVREAVTRCYSRETVRRRLEAARRISEMRLPVADWPEMEAEITRGAVDD